ncbi:ALA-interacting subunit 1 [Hordeum vulgare]|nr:ALA-interacting subunit 1 [Hordeum vulgare]
MRESGCPRRDGPRSGRQRRSAIPADDREGPQGRERKEGLHKAAIEERKARVSENKSMSLLLAEENKIMSMNHNDMDDLTKAWHDMARREILKRRMVASIGPLCSSSGDVFSAPYGANVDDFGAGVGTSDGGGFCGVDELQYGLHGVE